MAQEQTTTFADAAAERRREAHAKQFADMLAVFEAFGMRAIGTVQGATVFICKRTGGNVEQWHYHDWWIVSDNGGELNVQRVNSDTTMRSVSSTYFSTVIDGATMAYRVRCVVDGEAIDYSRSFVDDLDTLRGHVAGLPKI